MFAGLQSFAQKSYAPKTSDIDNAQSNYKSLDDYIASSTITIANNPEDDGDKYINPIIDNITKVYIDLTKGSTNGMYCYLGIDDYEKTKSIVFSSIYAQSTSAINIFINNKPYNIRTLAENGIFAWLYYNPQNHNEVIIDVKEYYGRVGYIKKWQKNFRTSFIVNIVTKPNGIDLTDKMPYTIEESTDVYPYINYIRTFGNTNWQALYIPFSMSYSDWKDDFEVAYINGIRQLDRNDDGVIDETIMDIVKIKKGNLIPNTPYLIKAKTTGEKTMSVNNTTLYEAKENSIDCRTTIAEYTFTGTYSTISAATLIENNYYTMDGGALVMSDGDNDLMPYRWYMKMESRNPMYNMENAAKMITINVIGEEEEETTTGISQKQMPIEKSFIYDLNGRKVNENNLQPGVYIKNGKKYAK